MTRLLVGAGLVRPPGGKFGTSIMMLVLVIGTPIKRLNSLVTLGLNRADRTRCTGFVLPCSHDGH